MADLGTIAIPGVDRFRLIYADPPWTYADKSLHRGGAARNYECCSLPDIGAHIEALADPSGCCLATWQTWPLQQEQDAMFKVFGWRRRTLLFDWVKLTAWGELAVGQGHYTRANSEPVFLWTKGRDWPRVVAHDVHQVVPASGIEPRRLKREHSRKPDEVRDRIERLWGPVPRVEMYRRGPPLPGWAVWGDEVTAA